MKPLSILISLLLLGTLSCKDAGTSIDGNQLGIFQYSASDRNGTQVMRGTIVLHRNDAGITGVWQFTDGRSGELKGTIDNDMISLNLNPDLIDSNLLLTGRLSGSAYTGEWEQIGFAGVMASGTFMAIKR